MSQAYHDAPSAVLIGDPDPARQALWREIFQRYFGAQVEAADTFKELLRRARASGQWRLIFVADNLPLDETYRNVLLPHYLLLLDRDWSNRLVCVLGEQLALGEHGLTHKPLGLHVPAGTSADIGSAWVQEMVNQLRGLKQVWPTRQLRRLHGGESDAVAEAVSQLVIELDDCLAELGRTEQWLEADQQETEQLSSASERQLTELEHRVQHVGTLGKNH